MTMNLQVILPTEVLVNTEAAKVTAQAENGSFCMLPRHVDFVSNLIPGILLYTDAEDHEYYLAVDRGTLVKCGDRVMVSTLNAVMGKDLDTLQQTVEQTFESLDERERMARTALARLEAGTVRRFMQLEELRRG